ncbi:MAG TPA: ABC transporter ATP-binding protein [Thermoplasmata archaeon]|nr:ABC transporter ATP-binding protein [Thermoplasmata archaeon]
MEALGIPEPTGTTSGRGVVLEVERLNKAYRGRRGRPPTPANTELTLRVHAGEIVALLGPNGAGKSTFLKQIAGQLLPDSGTIRVGGVDMIAHPRRAKEHVSVTPQECQPILSLTASEQVRTFGRIKGWNRAQADLGVPRVLEAVGLTGEAHKVVRDLSGGYKRRLLIAIAMAGSPTRLMLLDEPTTGLDPEARRAVWKVVHRLRAEGLGILLTTHYIDEAEYLADRVVVMHEGRFALSGTVEQIRARLPFRGRIDVRDVDRLSPGARAQVDDLARRGRVAFRSEGFVRIELAEPFSPETMSSLAALHRMGAAATLAPVSLEDAYLSVVGSLAENGR